MQRSDYISIGLSLCHSGALITKFNKHPTFPLFLPLPNKSSSSSSNLKNKQYLLQSNSSLDTPLLVLDTLFFHLTRLPKPQITNDTAGGPCHVRLLLLHCFRNAQTSLLLRAGHVLHQCFRVQEILLCLSSISRGTSCVRVLRLRLC